jgi:serine/threonine protein kinase
MIGTTVGKYRIVALLGRGATGIVYRALDDSLDREVAIKVLNPLYADGDVLKRFRSEATTLARLSHPEIATIHELLRTDTNLLMVMELVRGETLEVLAERKGPLSPDLAGHILDGILSALEHAHHAGIVHRDLKPANVMVTELGGIKIMDFGIARVRGAEHMTVDGCAVGTPAYMAPEQVLGEEVDGRADLYAVGLILYRLLAGRLPFDADTPITMLQKQISEIPPPLHVYRQDLPEWCDAVVQRALAKSSADRFQTAGEFREAVGRAIGLPPALDLAKAVGISEPSSSSAAPEAQPAETVVISRTDAGLSPDEAGSSVERASEHASVVGADLPATLARIKAAVLIRPIAAIIAAACALAVLTFLANSTGDIAERSLEARSAGGRSSPRGRPITASVPPPPAGSAARSKPAATPRSVAGSGSPASEPTVFRAKLILTEGRDGREENARLSFTRDQLSVATTDAPDDPVFAVPYRDVTAVEHSSRPAWKPPPKWSRVIKIEDEVLESIGIRDRHEIAVRTDAAFVRLRIDDQIVHRVLRTLKAHTGLSPEPAINR